MRTIRIYSRPGCHLCEQLIEQIMRLTRDRGRLEVVDVDSREDWRQAYGTRVPVVEIDGCFVCQHELDRSALAHALDGNRA